jgi:uncharacterized protein
MEELTVLDTAKPIETETDNLAATERSTVKRAAKRASYDRLELYSIIDTNAIGHIGFIENNTPFVIPLNVWRMDNALYLHCLNGGRLSKHLATQDQVCVSFAEHNAWVLSKSAYHTSANYRSAVLFGQFTQVRDQEEFDRAFATVINQIEAGRWDKVRQPSPTEIKTTAMLKMDIHEGSVKSRTGGPNEEPDDLELPVWSGILPLITSHGDPEVMY